MESARQDLRTEKRSSCESSPSISMTNHGREVTIDLQERYLALGETVGEQLSQLLQCRLEKVWSYASV